MKLYIRVSAKTQAEASRSTGELRSILTPMVQSLTQTQERGEYQDLGTTLVVILGTPACIALAKGVHDFISKRGCAVSIMTDSGSVVATGSAARNIDIAATVAALRTHPE